MIDVAALVRAMAELDDADLALLAERLDALRAPRPAPPAAARDLVSTADAAAALGVSAKTLRAMIARGDLAATRVGRLWRVARADLDALAGSPARERRSRTRSRERPAPLAPLRPGESLVERERASIKRRTRDGGIDGARRGSER